MSRETLAEGTGTALLLYVIVGSGIAAERLGDDAAVQLLAHGLVVGLGLGALIAIFQTVSGSHFNPSVTLAFWRSGDVSGSQAVRYLIAQLIGAMSGVVLANLTFELDAVAVSSTTRGGVGLAVAELIATFVLVLSILALVRTDRTGAVPAVVGAWVAAVVFATSSTGFANPAVTVARVLTDSYTGIAPASIPGFLVSQLVAGIAAAVVATRTFSKPVPLEPSI